MEQSVRLYGIGFVGSYRVGFIARGVFGARRPVGRLARSLDGHAGLVSRSVTAAAGTARSVPIANVGATVSGARLRAALGASTSWLAG